MEPLLEVQNLTVRYRTHAGAGVFALTGASLRIAPGEIVGVLGESASGKSTLGIEVALQFGGEVINCDSVQVYQGIQIATAKVPIEERRGVPHHLIDFVSPNINYTAGDWAREAAATIAEIQRRGRVPVQSARAGAAGSSPRCANGRPFRRPVRESC